MHLSSVDLFGFKSFARRTRISFDRGVTAIVGPNGCGKSNIVDAVRWVLGEQRESALRSERMDNVIFGGSSRRRPLGMAEISLTLHDTDGSLPIEFNEVTITRRLFRSGKSEYLLNKTVCRLKDLMDLFMDTGVGSDSYSIIELKMVEDIISEDPDQMRSLLDEATGITRYKARRKEALRRLLEARQDRERALDILVEVERQANGLKRQVARVRAYKRLEERARRVRSAIILGEVRKLEASLAPMEDSLNQWQIEMQRTSGDLSGGEAELMRLEGELLQLENDRQDCAYRFNAAQSDFQSATGLKARNEEEIRLNRWRMEKNREETEKTSTDLKGVEEQIQVAQSDLEACQANWPAVEARLRERQLTFQQADEKFRETRAKSIQNAEKLRSLRAREAEAIRLSEERRAALNSRQARLEELHQRKAELQENLQKKKEDLAQAESELAEKSRKLSEVRSRHAEIDDNIEKLREQLRDLEQELDQASARRDRVALQIDHFKEMHRRSSPLYAAGGALASKFPNLVSATLQDELQVDERYVKALECSLQAMAYSRVVSHRDSFETLLNYLESEQAGRVALLLGEAPDIDISPARAFATETGGRALADVIEGNSRTSRWIRHFVRNIVLFESLTQVIKLASQAAQRNIALVTPAGEFSDGRGLWIVGKSGGEPPRSVGVSARLQELAGHLQGSEDHLRKLQGDIAGIRNELTAWEAQLLDIEKLQREVEQAFDLEQVRKLKLEAQAAGANLLLEQISVEIARIPARIQELTSEEKTQEEEYTSVLEQLRSLEAELHQRQDVEARALEEREVLRQALAEVQIEAERARAETQRAGDRIAELGRRRQRLSERLAALSEEKQSLASDEVRLAAELEAQQENVTEVGAQVEDLRNKLDEADSRRRDLQEAQRNGNARVRELRARMEEVSQKIHQVQLEKVQIETALKEERLKLEGVDLAEIGDESPDPGLLADLEKKMRLSEPLNLAAENEYNEQKKRLDFLNEQLRDLEEAERSLEQTVTTLNEEAREKFETGFGRIRENFKLVFQEIFEGGEANIQLNHDDALESRIEILATPGNKRIGSLSLLSGGEKALTAIALLFAIYMEKPSPFCILDEVDAPLDDENTLRFCRLLNKFSPNTQFLVVTHNKQTMEVAQNLLGVTMEEDGISKVVPVQIS